MKLIKVRCGDAVHPKFLKKIDELISLEEKFRRKAIQICPAAKADIEKWSNYYISKYKQAKAKKTESEMKTFLLGIKRADAPADIDDIIDKYDEDGKLEQFVYDGKEFEDINQLYGQIIDFLGDYE